MVSSWQAEKAEQRATAIQDTTLPHTGERDISPLAACAGTTAIKFPSVNEPSDAQREEVIA